MSSTLSRALTPRAHARHAKPSKAAPVLLAGGLAATFAVVDGAALAGAASAGGSTAQFERLAQCESGGNWSINTGNGYYGGIQFNLATWRGLGFSGYPHQASKATQIAAGQKLQSQRGWSPWPACSRKLGLRGDGGVPTSDQGNATAAPRKAAPVSGPARVAGARASRSRSTTSPLTTATAQQQVVRTVAPPKLTPVAAPRFDGHVLSTADQQTYRIAVKHWQRRMNARGWRLSVDGHFGPQSARVASSFAAERGLKAPAGSVTKAVWDAAWTSRTDR